MEQAGRAIIDFKLNGWHARLWSNQAFVLIMLLLCCLCSLLHQRVRHDSVSWPSIPVSTANARCIIAEQSCNEVPSDRDFLLLCNPLHRPACDVFHSLREPLWEVCPKTIPGNRGCLLKGLGPEDCNFWMPDDSGSDCIAGHTDWPFLSLVAALLVRLDVRLIPHRQLAWLASLQYIDGV